MVAKDVVPVGQQVVGFNELKDSSVDRSGQGVGEKEIGLLTSFNTRKQLKNPKVTDQ